MLEIKVQEKIQEHLPSQIGIETSEILTCANIINQRRVTSNLKNHYFITNNYAIYRNEKGTPILYFGSIPRGLAIDFLEKRFLEGKNAKNLQSEIERIALSKQHYFSRLRIDMRNLDLKPAGTTRSCLEVASVQDLTPDKYMLLEAMIGDGKAESSPRLPSAALTFNIQMLSKKGPASIYLRNPEELKEGKSFTCLCVVHPFEASTVLQAIDRIDEIKLNEAPYSLSSFAYYTGREL